MKKSSLSSGPYNWTYQYVQTSSEPKLVFLNLQCHNNHHDETTIKILLLTHIILVNYPCFPCIEIITTQVTKTTKE